jgi:ABC-type antimicrobial peptide transport system ATPase subunit
MIIIQSEINPNQLIIQFTQAEQQNTLYVSTVNQLKELYSQINEENTTITVDDITNVGQTVDTVRELFCGDVIFEYDESSNPLPKDLSDCPLFTLGEVDEVIPDDSQP